MDEIGGFWSRIRSTAGRGREGKGDPENATCFEKYEQSGP